MRLTWDKHTKTLSGGAAAALVCGIMLGGAMRPDFGDDGRPAGPQQISGSAGVRSTGPFDPGASAASYGANVPDYVMGTDWKRTMAWPDPSAATSPPARLAVVRAEAAEADAEPAWGQPARHAEYAPTPPARGRYPSLGGAGEPAPADTVDDDGAAVAITG